MTGDSERPTNGPYGDRCYRLIVIYEIEGADTDEAEEKLDKLNRAAKRIGLPQGFIDNWKFLSPS